MSHHEPLSPFEDRFLGVKRVCCTPGVPMRDQPGLGHNRWHPDVTPAVEIAAGEEVILEALEPFDGQIHDNGDPEEMRRFDTASLHPLTGPVYVDGAEPGDLLDVEILGVEPVSGVAISNIFPGTPGILGETFPEGSRSTWYARGGIAESPQLPGIRIPAQPHPGTIGVAPSLELIERWAKRERPLQDGGDVWAPTERGAILPGVDPALWPTAPRTQAPRENGGNMDINKLGTGARVWFPVFVKGGLLSLGDHHLSAGDGECSWNAMEMDGRSWLRIKVIKDGMARHAVKTPIVQGAPVGWHPSPDRYLGFTGFCFDDREQAFQDATFSMREAMLRAVDYLMTLGYTGEQAYTILSVAPIQVHISCIVTLPNPSVTLYLPIDIFDRDVLPTATR